MSWAEVAFSDVLSDVTGGNEKTKQSDYAMRGKYPIVDQGQSLVGGYTNDSALLCKSQGPLIIFGDHTRAIKYIDFPFCLGADGTKVLKAKEGTHPKYLFYALHNIYIPEAGYSRHFKYLKTGKIPLPPLDEQRRIAGILDQADALRRLRARALDKLNTLGQAIFQEMFGDPATNEHDFLPRKLSQIIRIVGGSQPAKKFFLYEDGPDRVRFVQTRDFKTDEYKTYVPRELAKRPFNEDDVIIGRYGPPVFQIFRGLSGTYNVALMKAEPVGGITKDFVYYLLREPNLHKYVIANSERTAGQSGVNLALLNDYPVFAPPIKLQQEFSRRLMNVKMLHSDCGHAFRESEALFTSLQHRAFRGEL